MPRGGLWRYGQAGDLPGDGRRIDVDALSAIAAANRGKRGYGYTHYLARPRTWSWARWSKSPTFRHNADAIASANRDGFAVNVSTERVEDVDRMFDLGIAGIVTILPLDDRRPVRRTPAGRPVVLCLHYRFGYSCARCGLCARGARRFAIGLPVCGSPPRRAKVQKVLFGGS